MRTRCLCKLAVHAGLGTGRSLSGTGHEEGSRGTRQDVRHGERAPAVGSSRVPQLAAGSPMGGPEEPFPLAPLPAGSVREAAGTVC